MSVRPCLLGAPANLSTRSATLTRLGTRKFIVPVSQLYLMNRKRMWIGVDRSRTKNPDRAFSLTSCVDIRTRAPENVIEINRYTRSLTDRAFCEHRIARAAHCTLCDVRCITSRMFPPGEFLSEGASWAGFKARPASPCRCPHGKAVSVTC